jgi:hypothetical protein
MNADKQKLNIRKIVSYGIGKVPNFLCKCSCFASKLLVKYSFGNRNLLIAQITTKDKRYWDAQ